MDSVTRDRHCSTVEALATPARSASLDNQYHDLARATRALSTSRRARSLYFKSVELRYVIWSVRQGRRRRTG